MSEVESGKENDEKFEFKDRDLSKRTKDFSLRIIALYGSLGTDVTSQVIGKQVLRSGTSPGAHYHEAIHARSNAEIPACHAGRPGRVRDGDLAAH